MRYRVAHYKYLLDFVGQSVLSKIAECSRRRTLFLVQTRDIASLTARAFQKKRGESNDRNGIPIFPRRRLHFVWFSGSQAKHLMAKVRNRLKQIDQDCADIILVLC